MVPMIALDRKQGLSCKNTMQEIQSGTLVLCALIVLLLLQLCLLRFLPVRHDHHHDVTRQAATVTSTYFYGNTVYL